MARKRRSAEQIIRLLRSAEAMSGKGNTISETARSLGIPDTTHCRLRKEYGGTGMEQAKRMRELEKKNSRLKRLVSDLSPDNQSLRDSQPGNS